MTTHNDIVWINNSVIDSLIPNLHDFFIVDDEFGPFLSFLKDDHGVRVYPIFFAQWTLNQETLAHIERVEKQQIGYSKTVNQGPIMECSLSDGNVLVFRPELT